MCLIVPVYGCTEVKLLCMNAFHCVNRMYYLFNVIRF